MSETFYNNGYAILCSSCFWTFCYFCIKQTFHNKSPEWCSRAVTLIHGIGSAITGLSECNTNKEDLFAHAHLPQTDNQQIILLVSLGYFLFDLSWCLYYQTESKIMLTHHVFSTFALYRLLSNNYAGAQTCCGIGGMEITNPLLQLRWFIKNSDFHNKWFIYAESIFIISFFIMRIGFGTYFFVNVIFFHKYNIEYVCYTTTLYAISWLFVVNILQYLQGKYLKKERK